MLSTTNQEHPDKTPRIHILGRASNWSQTATFSRMRGTAAPPYAQSSKGVTKPKSTGISSILPAQIVNFNDFTSASTNGCASTRTCLRGKPLGFLGILTSKTTSVESYGAEQGCDDAMHNIPGCLKPPLCCPAVPGTQRGNSIGTFSLLVVLLFVNFARVRTFLDWNTDVGFR